MNKKEKKEIIWNVVNSILAGALVFLGSFTAAEELTLRGIFFATITTLIVIVTKFKDYWATEQTEYSHVFNFV